MNSRPLKAYVRYDGSGRVVSGSLILRKNKPKVGKWKELTAYECCNPPIPTPVYQFGLAYGTDGKGSVCFYPISATYYSSTYYIGNGVILYTDINLSNVAPNGWYSLPDSGVANEITNNDGVIMNTIPCEE